MTSIYDSVEKARTSFEERWTPSSLSVVDSDLCGRLMRQVDLWNMSVVTGSQHEMEIQGAAMIRGYEAATKALSAYRETAHMLGKDYSVGRAVCISARQGSLERVTASSEFPVVWLHPDAVARLLTAALAAGIEVPDA